MKSIEAEEPKLLWRYAITELGLEDLGTESDMKGIKQKSLKPLRQHAVNCRGVMLLQLGLEDLGTE